MLVSVPKTVLCSMTVVPIHADGELTDPRVGWRALMAVGRSCSVVTAVKTSRAVEGL